MTTITMQFYSPQEREPPLNIPILVQFKKDGRYMSTKYIEYEIGGKLIVTEEGYATLDEIQCYSELLSFSRTWPDNHIGLGLIDPNSGGIFYRRLKNY